MSVAAVSMSVPNVPLTPRRMSEVMIEKFSNIVRTKRYPSDDESIDSSRNYSDVFERLKSAFYMSPTLLFLRRYSPEMIVLLAQLAVNVSASLDPTFKEQKLKDKYRDVFWDQSKDAGEAMLGDIQKAWSIRERLSYYPLAALVSLLLAAHGDRYGRQVPMLAGLTHGVVNIATSMVFFSGQLDLAMWYRLPFNVITSLFGDQRVTSDAVQAYIVDTVPDKATVSIRIAFVNVAMSLVGIPSSLLVGLIFSRLEPHHWYLTSIGIYVVLFLFTLIVMPQVPPEKMKRRVRGVLRAQSTIAVLARRGFITICKLLLELLTDLWSTLTKPRRGHKRLLLWLTLLVVMLDQPNTQEIGLLFETIFTDRQLLLDPSTAAWYTGVHNAMRVLGLLIGTPLMMKWLKLDDVGVCLVAVASLTAQVALLANASADWELFAAAVLGAFSALTQPAITSFQAHIVSTREIGKVFTLTTNAYFFANLLQLTASSSLGESIWYVIVTMCAVMALLLVLIWILHFVVDGRQGLDKPLPSVYQ